MCEQSNHALKWSCKKLEEMRTQRFYGRKEFDWTFRVIRSLPQWGQWTGWKWQRVQEDPRIRSEEQLGNHGSVKGYTYLMCVCKHWQVHVHNGVCVCVCVGVCSFYEGRCKTPGRDGNPNVKWRKCDIHLWFIKFHTAQLSAFRHTETHTIAHADPCIMHGIPHSS